MTILKFPGMPMTKKRSPDGQMIKRTKTQKRERWETKQDDSKQMARESNDQTKRKTSM